MDLSSFITAGFNILPKTSVVVNGTTVECLFNQSDHNDSNVLGGFEPDNQAVLSIKTELLSNPRALKGKIVSLNQSNWRVMNVKFGNIITHLTVVADNKA